MHGNVCLESVVVTPTLDWKLHAFDALSEFDGNNEVSTGPMLVTLRTLPKYIHISHLICVALSDRTCIKIEHNIKVKCLQYLLETERLQWQYFLFI